MSDYTFAPERLDDEVFGGAPKRPAAQIAFGLLLLGGAIGGYWLYTSYSTRPDDRPAKPTAGAHEVDPAKVTRDVARVVARVMAPPDMTAEQRAAIAREEERLAKRRAEITARLRGEGFVEGAEQAANERVQLEAGFTHQWPRAGAVSEESLANHVLDAPGDYRRLAEQLGSLGERLSGTRVGDDVSADAALLTDAMALARKQRLEELRGEADRLIAAGEFAKALAVYTRERFPIELIPRVDYFDDDAQAAYEAGFHQSLQAALVYPIALKHFTPAATALQAAWKGGDIVRLVTADALQSAIGPLALPADAVTQQIERARQHFLAPFSQRFLDLVRETNRYRPSAAAGVPDAIAKIEAQLAPVLEWGLPEYATRVRGIVDGYREEFADRFGHE
ncbi:MAG: hypothetical protein AB7S36_16570 [Planctomycetota bacterium]